MLAEGINILGNNISSVVFQQTADCKLQTDTMATFSNMISVFFLVFFVSIASSNPSDDLTKGVNQFSADFFAYFSKNHGGQNIFTSPFSNHLILTLLSTGANGKTLQEMNQALHMNSENTKNAYKNAIENMNSYKHVTLKLSGKVYVSNNEKLQPEFKTKATQIFNSEIESIDLSNGDEAVRKINSWVRSKTNEKVRNFLNAKHFTNSTSAVLVNAIYFKGNWDKKFNQQDTTNDDFYIRKNHAIKVDTMHQTNNFNYGENTELDAKIVQLQFYGNEASMVFFLPNDYEGLPSMQEKIKNANFESVIKNLQPEDVSVSLPKFDIETGAAFQLELENLGMKTMFTNQADFRGMMTSQNSFKVDYVYQKAFIGISESGAESGNAFAQFTGKTNGIKRGISMEFKADHPFFFALVNKDYQVITCGQFTGVNHV